MKQILLFITGCFAVLFSQAQTAPIMVCNASGFTCAPYYNLDTAYTAANTGDYIYLPGGVFTFNLALSKGVHIIGAGQNMDSSQATNFTTLNGNLTLANGADNASIEGMYITGVINSNANTSLNNFIIRYCSFYSFNCNINNSSIVNCIFRSNGLGENSFNGGIGDGIANCYIRDISNINSSYINNCTGILYCNNITLTSFKNNIFTTYPSSPFGQPGGNNSMNYNVYTNPCPYYCLSVIYASNLLQLSEADIFLYGAINFSEMHLLPGSAALTAGENGAQVGVYGGFFPFKEGSVPSNPHIFQKTIGASTNSNGQLPVQIKVRAESY